jgi:monovalent cation:H+ antiporter-2, CPA2 family
MKKLLIISLADTASAVIHLLVIYSLLALYIGEWKSATNEQRLTAARIQIRSGTMRYLCFLFMIFIAGIACFQNLRPIHSVSITQKQRCSILPPATTTNLADPANISEKRSKFRSKLQSLTQLIKFPFSKVLQPLQNTMRSKRPLSLITILIGKLFILFHNSRKALANAPAVAKNIVSATTLANPYQQTPIEPVVVEVERSWKMLTGSLQGVRLDTIIMLVATSAVIPLFKSINVSPIIGFLMTGTLIGPGGMNWVKDVHLVDILGEIGIVFFLFEMGLELSLDRLKAMKNDVFGLGTCQFLLTAMAGTFISLTQGLSLPAAFTIGGSLALSSSAFVLQLLKDKDAMASRHGKASFGILLLQDLAVVPLLVIVELLGEGGTGLGRALMLAGVKAVVTLSTLSLLGKKFLNPLFSFVAKSRSQEAFLSIIFTTIFIMSFITKGIGLSDTLGAFLAGILLSETSYRYQIEADIAIFRGFLLGLFFMTVGFNIDLSLVASSWKTILSMLVAMISGKALIITGLAVIFGVPLASAQLCGLLNSQGGEFAFVSLGMAERMGLLTRIQSKLLMTTVALSMAVTPLLAELGIFISKRIEKKLGFVDYVGKNPKDMVVPAHEMSDQNFVFLCGYGRVGKMISSMFDRTFIKYIAVDNSPQKALEARNKGLPVFFGKL